MAAKNPPKQEQHGEYDNELRGALFRNKKKVKGDKRPDYTGNCQIEGVEYWMSAWIMKSKAGDTYMSFRFENKNTAPGRVRGGGSEETEDDIPF